MSSYGKKSISEPIDFNITAEVQRREQMLDKLIFSDT
jgi:hypothetical protein